MWPDRVSNPGPLTYESGALPTALRGTANSGRRNKCVWPDQISKPGPLALEPDTALPTALCGPAGIALNKSFSIEWLFPFINVMGEKNSQ